MDDNRRMLTTRELAARLSVHPVTVLRWVAEGRLPRPFRAARTIRFDPVAIDKAIGERTGQ